MKHAVSFISLLLAMSVSAQTYDFTVTDSVAVTPVKNQASSGTCWCFATASFLESELLRKGKGEHDLSEMFIVRQKLINQLNDNYLRRGRGNIGQGSLSHTVIMKSGWIRLRFIGERPVQPLRPTDTLLLGFQLRLKDGEK